MTVNIEEVFNRQKIRELVERYTFVINHRYWDQLQGLFANDAIWRAVDPINQEFNGLDNIITRIPQNVEKLEFLFQTSSEILIEVASAARASVHSQLTEVGRFSETGKGMHAIGAYEDVVVFKDNQWKFLERTFILRYIDNDCSLEGMLVRG